MTNKNISKLCTSNLEKNTLCSTLHALYKKVPIYCAVQTTITKLYVYTPKLLTVSVYKNCRHNKPQT